MFKISLPIKITFISLIVSLTAIVALSLLAYQDINTTLKEQALSRLNDDLKREKDDYINSLETFGGDLLYLASHDAIQGVIRARGSRGYDEKLNLSEDDWQKRLINAFRSVMEHRQSYSQIRFIGIAEDGKEIIRVNRRDGVIMTVAKEDLQKKGRHKHYQKTLEKPAGEIYFDDITLNRENGRIVYPYEPVLHISVPIFSEDKELFGLLIFNINFQIMTARLQNHPPGIFYFLADSKGNYLYHPEPAKMFSFEKGNPLTFQDEYQAGQLISIIHEEKGHSHKRLIPALQVGLAIDHYHFDPSLDDRFLIFGAVASLDNIEAESLAFRNKLLKLLLIITVLVIGFVLFTSRLLTKPILHLTTVAHKIADGVEDVEIDITTRDEVGLLALTMQTMLTNLKDGKLELKQAKDLSEAINENIPSAILTFKAGKVLLANQHFDEFFQLTINVDDDIAEILQQLKFPMTLAESISRGVNFSNHEFNCEKAIIAEKIFTASLNQFTDDDSRIETYLLVIDDITKTSQTIVAKQRAVSDAAYQSGVAEISTSVLHNIGNSINNVAMRTTEFNDELDSLTQIADLLEKSRAEVDEELAGWPGYQQAEATSQLMNAMGKVPELLRNNIAKKMTDNLQGIKTGVDHIIDIVRVQQSLMTGGMVANEEFHLPTLIGDSLALLQESLTSRHISPNVSIDQELPKLYLPRNLLIQLFTNLIKNSYEAIDERQKNNPVDGLLDIIVACHGSDWQLTIKDNGCGLEASQCSQVFQFGQSSKDRGSGIGLHWCGNFVKSLGGTIEIRSDGLNKGAVVAITLPQRVTKND